MGEERAWNAVPLDAVGSVGCFALLGGESLRWAIWRVDGGSLNAEAQGAEENDFAQDKDHGERGVTADQISDGAGGGRSGGAGGGIGGM